MTDALKEAAGAVILWSNERDTCVDCGTWDDHYEGRLIADLDDALNPKSEPLPRKSGDAE